MSDKKLNESKIVKDMDYVLVTLADGSVGQIAKSDLASVVAGVLGNPAGTKGYIENVYPNISSYDEVVSSGIYTISDSVSVSPKNGVLVVNASSAVVFQTFYGQNGENQSRLRWYGNWSPWQRIDNFGYNSLKELAGGVATEMGLDVLPYGYHSLTQSSPFTMNIPKNALIMVSEIYYGYHLVLFAQNAKNVVAKLSESSGSPFSVSMSNGTLIVSVSNGGYDIHVSSLSFN